MILTRAIVAIVLTIGLTAYLALKIDGRPWSLNTLISGVYESLVTVAGALVALICLLSWIISF